MGYLASAATIYARAYLTSKGREYLFNRDNIRFNSLGQDLFKIETFTLGDPDVNYETSQVLPEGWVPDISGKYDSCLKTALDYEQRNLLFYQNFDSVITEDIDYTTDANGNLINVDVNIGSNDIPVGVDGTQPAGGGGLITDAPNVDRNAGGTGGVVVGRPNNNNGNTFKNTGFNESTAGR